MPPTNIKNPEAFAKRKAERQQRRKRPVTLPQHLSIKKDVLMNDGTRVNIPVGDILRMQNRVRMQQQIDKYPKAFRRQAKSRG